MNLDHDLVGKKTHALGGRFIKQLLHHIHLNEMVARPQRPNLAQTPLHGPVTYLTGICSIQAATFLRTFQVALRRIPVF